MLQPALMLSFLPFTSPPLVPFTGTGFWPFHAWGFVVAGEMVPCFFAVGGALRSTVGESTCLVLFALSYLFISPRSPLFRLSFRLGRRAIVSVAAICS